MNLNGTWKLYFAPQGKYKIDTPAGFELKGVPSVPATVPGNVELDLSKAGLLPEDLFKGMNITEAERFEDHEYWYERKFTPPEAPDTEHRAILHFGAVDCYAEYYLNGEKFGESDNMFISRDFDLTDRLNYGEENTLHVHLSSALIAGNSPELDPGITAFSWQNGLPSVNSRKAPHSYGWDIMPRAISAGIWRGVELKLKKKYDFRYIYFHLNRIGEKSEIRMMFDAKAKPEHIFADLNYVVTGRCGDHSFEYRQLFKGVSGRLEFEVEGLKLWWPRNYGEANLYDITVKAYTKDGELVMSRVVRRGFRTLELRRSEIVEKGGEFRFYVNNTPIMALGSNWVPMDPYHSRDNSRYKKALELALDVNCNILRCWGGNVYEDRDFFDFCDENGIMVWQDFAMACHFYPQTEAFAKAISLEAEHIIRELRDHPCLILWSGDNEIDQMCNFTGGDPAKNHITRELLPRILERLDPYRPYIASSPFTSPKAVELGQEYWPEDHLWGPRDYFKSDFYVNSKAYFVSETGYHGCPSRKSIEKFIDKDYVWPYFDNPQWNLHSSDQRGSDSRVMLMDKQVRQLFGEAPTDMDDYVLASQISQAEAMKFFVERVRAKMDRMGGVIWWNLMDGWPQMSDAVVDYYYEKKLAYHYLKRSCRDFMIMIDELKDWDHEVICANGTLKEFKGTCTVTDMDTGRLILKKDFTAKANSNTSLGKFPLMRSEQGMFLIKWKLDSGEEYFNTYLYGGPRYSLEKYKDWLNTLNSL